MHLSLSRFVKVWLWSIKTLDGSLSIIDKAEVSNSPPKPTKTALLAHAHPSEPLSAHNLIHGRNWFSLELFVTLIRFAKSHKFPLFVCAVKLTINIQSNHIAANLSRWLRKPRLPRSCSNDIFPIFRFLHSRSLSASFLEMNFLFKWKFIALFLPYSRTSAKGKLRAGRDLKRSLGRVEIPKAFEPRKICLRAELEKWRNYNSWRKAFHQPRH